MRTIKDAATLMENFDEGRHGLVKKSGHLSDISSSGTESHDHLSGTVTTSHIVTLELESEFFYGNR